MGAKPLRCARISRPDAAACARKGNGIMNLRMRMRAHAVSACGDVAAVDVAAVMCCMQCCTVCSDNCTARGEESLRGAAQA